MCESSYGVSVNVFMFHVSRFTFQCVNVYTSNRVLSVPDSCFQCVQVCNVVSGYLVISNPAQLSSPLNVTCTSAPIVTSTVMTSASASSPATDRLPRSKQAK